MTRDRMPHVGYDEIEDPAVAAVLAAARAPGEAPLPGEAEALAAYREMFAPVRSARHARPAKRSRESIKLLAATIFGGVVMASGVATAATGGSFLPFHHPAPSHVKTHHASTPDDGDQPSTGTPDTDQPPTTGSTIGSSNATTPDNHGTQVSQVAGDHSTTGKAHGEAVCTTASSSRCVNQGLSSTTTHGPSTASSHGQSTATSHRRQPHTTSTSAPGKSSTAGSASSTHSGGHDQVGLTHRHAH